MTSSNTQSRDAVFSSPILRKHSQADEVIYGDHVRTRVRNGDVLSPQRFFKRSTWSRSSDSRPSIVGQPQYSPAPSSMLLPSLMVQRQYSPAASSMVFLGATVAPGKPLTEVLVEHQPYLLELATRAPFLVAAGTGNLSKTLLSKWMSQDRLYAQAYIGFIGALISRVDLPYAYVEDKKSSLRWRIVNMLSYSLQNIHRELNFFEDVAKRHSLNLEEPQGSDFSFSADTATKQYIDLFRAFWTDPTMTLLDGLVVLWATEYCYLKAWTYAKIHLNYSKRRDDLDGGALRNDLIPHWTSVDFENFVIEIADCTNLLATREAAIGGKIETF